MRVDAELTIDSSKSEIEQAKEARLCGTAEAEELRTLAAGLERLATATDALGDLDALFGAIVALVVEHTRFPLAVLRLREGDRLRARAAVGLEAEVASGFSASLDHGVLDGAARAPAIALVPDDAPARSDAMRRAGTGELWEVPLLASDALVGALYVGAPKAAGRLAWSGSERRLLLAVAASTGAAIARAARRRALDQGVRSRDAVLGVVAHDLRNPLSVITIAAKSQIQRVADPTARRALERILRGAQRADRIVRDLLDIQAIETGRYSVATAPIATAPLILAAVQSQHGPAAEAKVIVSTDLSPELPPIEADEGRLLEVLENLIGNAIKFTRAGGTITVGASRRDQEVVIWVRDSGRGIAKEELPHIFDRFWQAKKAERKGTGLGLTICKSIVEAHDGRIWAESVLGEGTTMCFTIPVTDEEDRLSSTGALANILLVDDRPENLVSLKAILARPEYRLVTAGSGEEALRLTLREQFSVVLMDVAMPGMSGLEVATHMGTLERSRDVPIIFITAFGNDPEQIHRAYAAGGVDYLVKPLDPDIVRKKVAVFVDLVRRRTHDRRARRDVPHGAEE
jgi:signal transduction histidine kinase/ActR/RegA family two-component response regulator